MEKRTHYLAFIALLLIQGATLCSLTGCSESENAELIMDDFAGRYEIISITSGQALDLNNDGIASNDLYSEYSAPFHWEDASYLPDSFDFTNPYNYAEFRRNELLSINLAEFRFPCQYFNDEFMLNNPRTPALRAYNWGLSHMYYQLEKDGEVSILPSTIPSDEPVDNMGYVRSLQRLTQDIFQVEMTLQIYDFKQQKWAITPVDIIYERRVIFS